MLIQPHPLGLGGTPRISASLCAQASDEAPMFHRPRQVKTEDTA